MERGPARAIFWHAARHGKPSSRWTHATADAFALWGRGTRGSRLAQGSERERAGRCGSAGFPGGTAARIVSHGNGPRCSLGRGAHRGCPATRRRRAGARAWRDRYDCLQGDTSMVGSLAPPIRAYVLGVQHSRSRRAMADIGRANHATPRRPRGGDFRGAVNDRAASSRRTIGLQTAGRGSRCTPAAGANTKAAQNFSWRFEAGAPPWAPARRDGSY